MIRFNGILVDPINGVSSRTRKQRRIDELLTKLRRNDTLIVSERSRLGRSLSEVVLLGDPIWDSIYPFWNLKFVSSFYIVKNLISSA